MMGGAAISQQTFASLAYNTKRRVTRRERFREEMNGVVPGRRFEAIVKPLYPKNGNGGPPIGVPIDRACFGPEDPGVDDICSEIITDWR